MRALTGVLIALSLITLISCNESDDPGDDPSALMQLSALRVGTVSILPDNIIGTPFDKPLIISFSIPVDRSTVTENVQLKKGQETLPLTFAYLDSDQTISASTESGLEKNTEYTLEILEDIQGINGETFPGISKTFTTLNPPLVINQVTVDGTAITSNTRVRQIDFLPEIQIAFSEPVELEKLNPYLSLSSNGVPYEVSGVQTLDSIITYTVSEELAGYRKYRIAIGSDLAATVGRPFDGYRGDFYTKLDSTLKFPEITDEALLTKVQEQTFKYFWDFGHPVSGLARERNTSGETVTIGGSGFGVMSILVGIERGFITRQEGIDRLETIINFLANDADRFHGVWSHWLNGTSGSVIPFSANDNGADLVETAFMIQGLLTVRQYLDPNVSQEAAMVTTINELWEAVEWDWFTQGGQDVLYWHWSPNFGWEKNHAIRGWNEALIIYVLAASSTTHTIDQSVYTEGWARGGSMVNSGNSTYYGYTLPLRSDRGGPLFFAHYSFLGLDPRNLSDQYADYWEQNRTHTLLNRAYCIDNPRNYIGYEPYSWGLTASDGNSGYSAHSPDNDRGVMTPTAAVSSIPYTPDESMEAIRHFYYILGDQLWGEYGFYDAFNLTEGWVASSYLAIDQGPIIVMIENHRTGLLWDLFMSAPEVQNGLDILGFTYE